MSMQFKDYSQIEKILSGTEIPKMFRVKQHFPDEKIANPGKYLYEKLNEDTIKSTVKPGMRIAITAGSRGIDNIALLIKTVADFLKANGAVPFIIPAMGSHGGASAEGQTAILKSYGITEEYCGCSIISSMDTVCIGTVNDDGKNLNVYVDKNAAEADGIVVINRIKAHTAFRGPYESGLLKMLCIGMGKQKGADSMHNDGFFTFPRRIPLFGNYVRTKLNVIFGVGLVENAYDKTARIEVLRNHEIPEREPELLEISKSLMPRILVPETDVLVVREIGKNISGAGLDPNITGTWSFDLGGGGIKSQRVAILGITEESHGNCVGLGLADTTSLGCIDECDFTASYPNSLTSTVFKSMKIPMVLKDDAMAIRAAVKTCNFYGPNGVRVVTIKNTLKMDEICLSEAFLDEVKGIQGIEVISKPEPMAFDSSGRLAMFD